MPATTRRGSRLPSLPWWQGSHLSCGRVAQLDPPADRRKCEERGVACRLDLREMERSIVVQNDQVGHLDMTHRQANIRHVGEIADDVVMAIVEVVTDKVARPAAASAQRIVSLRTY